MKQIFKIAINLNNNHKQKFKIFNVKAEVISMASNRAAESKDDMKQNVVQPYF